MSKYDPEELATLLRYPLIITQDGCWLFTGGSKNGFHGSLWYEGESWQAHRLAFHLMCEPIPDGMKVLHTCDVGLCVNPGHLFLGTQTDNVADMASKGRDNRTRRGSENGRALVTEAEVRTIRELADKGVSSEDLREQYNLSKTAIYRIINRISWRHV